jgi:hypothetical protein
MFDPNKRMELQVTSIWNIPSPDANYAANQAARVAVFNKIAPKDNWKLPIQCWIDEVDFADCNEAAIYFTGSPLTVTAKTGPLSATRLHVEAPGYYSTIGA